MHHGFARAGRAAGAISVWVVGQIVSRVAYGGIKAIGRWFVARTDIVEDGE